MGFEIGLWEFAWVDRMLGWVGALLWVEGVLGVVVWVVVGPAPPWALTGNPLSPPGRGRGGCSRTRGHVVVGVGTSAVVAVVVVFVHPPARCARVPLRKAKGGGVCFVFSWVPASAGMTG